MSQKLAWSANILLIVASVLVIGTLVRDRFFPPKSRTNQQLIGQVIKSEKAFPVVGNHALLFVLSTKCGYCAMESGFYKKIGTTTPKIETIAAFIQPEQEARKYLASRGILFDKVIQLDTAIVGMAGTPTIMLIDHSGKVTDAWAGRLPADQEVEVLKVAKGIS